jgi:dTDP-glucose 4,6-dehydratase
MFLSKSTSWHDASPCLPKLDFGGMRLTTMDPSSQITESDMKHVLVTGCGGSIGCHVMYHLLARTNWNITGIDSFRHKGLTDRLSAEIYQSPRVRIFTHDLTAPISKILTNKIGQLDYIINLAAISDVDVSLDDPAYAIKTNVDVMLNMVEYVRHRLYPQPVFLHVSTDECYGPVEEGMMHQEWDPIVPSNPYSASKACQEAIGISSWRSYGLPLIIVNIYNNFGEMQNPAKFPIIVQRKVRANEPVGIHTFGLGDYGSRYYLHSRNAADAMLFILENTTPFQHVPGRVDKPDRYNITDGVRIDNLEMAQLIAKFMGKPLLYEELDCRYNRPGHDRAYGLDGTKLFTLGWRPPLPFEESLRRVVEWYKQHPEWLYV